MSTDRARRPPLRRRLRQWWRRLKNEQATPGRLGVAVGLGVVVGCSPFWGLQILLSLALAWLLRLNKLAIVLGAHVSTPPFTPFIILGAAQIGEWLLHRRWLPMGLAEVRVLHPRDLIASLFADMLVGGLVLGGALGLSLGGATSVLVRRQRERSSREPTLGDDELDALFERLDRLSQPFRSYGAWKVRLDPLYPLALPHLGEARTVVDLGAGMGLIEALLAARSPGARIRAVEWDGRKAEAAKRLLEGLEGVSVERADARAVELGSPDAILLFDVLHYVAPAEQRAWLERCARALAPGGLLLIRELDSTPAKGNLAERLDRLAVRWGWNRAQGVQAWPIEQMTALLEGQGFTVETRPAGRGVFSANTMILARKPPASAP